VLTCAARRARVGPSGLPALDAAGRERAPCTHGASSRGRLCPEPPPGACCSAACACTATPTCNPRGGTASRAVRRRRQRRLKLAHTGVCSSPGWLPETAAHAAPRRRRGAGQLRGRARSTRQARLAGRRAPSYCRAAGTGGCARRARPPPAQTRMRSARGRPGPCRAGGVASAARPACGPLDRPDSDGWLSAGLGIP